MITANSKLNLFFTKMKKSHELEEHGFNLILEKENFHEYFDLLENEGFFKSNKAPLPLRINEGIVLPFWPATTFLLECAKFSGRTNQHELAKKIIKIIVDVTSYYESMHPLPFNFHVTKKFIEIYSELPTEIITLENIKLIEKWICNTHNNGILCHEIDKSLIKKYLSLGSDYSKYSLEILRILSSYSHAGENSKHEPIIEKYWLEQFYSNNIKEFGKFIGQPAISVLHGMINHLFSIPNKEPSILIRPAIEDNQQNSFKDDIENILIVAYRDCLNSWVDNNTEGHCNDFIYKLLTTENPLFRRIALNSINEHWVKLSAVFTENISASLFEFEYLHELYLLLKNNFKKLNKDQQRRILSIIQSITAPESIEEKVAYENKWKIRWASAISNQGFVAADEFLNDLIINQQLNIPEHPDFLYFIETSWNESKSVYSETDLIGLLDSGTLVEKLNSFKEVDSWLGNSIRGLAETLENSVYSEPSIFISKLSNLKYLKYTFIYSVLSGLKKSWEKSKKDGFEIDWVHAWPKIHLFIKDIIDDEQLWTDDQNIDNSGTPNAKWIPDLVADFIKSISREDSHSFSAEIFNVSLQVLNKIFSKAQPGNNGQKDPMSNAINSTYGKAIESFFSVALRMSRMEVAASGNNEATRQNIRPILSDLLKRETNENLEFHTLAATYLSNLEYLDIDWLSSNFSELFPEVESQFTAAIGGFIYGQPTFKTYELIKEHKIFFRSLQLNELNSDIQKGIIERIGLGYLWGFEKLSEGIFDKIFSEKRIDALCILSQYFWSLKRTDLKDEHISLINQFASFCLEWLNSKNIESNELLNKLALLTCYINELDSQSKAFIKSTSIALTRDNLHYLFIEDISRLVELDPNFTYEIIDQLFDLHPPIYDIQGNWLEIMKKLSSKIPHHKLIQSLEKIRNLNGISELMTEINN
ncbi:MAG: hypothetical protein RJB18_1359 [Pseudomonadota bacterium]|jgi:hypothetical protein